MGQGIILFARDGWPTVVDMNVGDTVDIDASGAVHVVRLVCVESVEEDDNLWFNPPDRQKTYRQASILLEVDGQPLTASLRPYQMPVEYGGLKLYVEMIKDWALDDVVSPISDLNSDVRLSIGSAGKPWCCENIVFPLRECRWRSSTYQNTWSAWVTYNARYYHRGEDFGAIPDLMEVQAALPGRVTESPLPTGDGKSNRIALEFRPDTCLNYAHMNIEHIALSVKRGNMIGGGALLGRTGCTWNGSRTQYSDPHLHVSMSHGKHLISPYPFLIEAYFRTYPDALVPVAGGHGFVLKGGCYRLDGSRSVARHGRRIVSMEWRLHDGHIVKGSCADIRCEETGLFSEELVVRADDGSEDRDYFHLRVFDPARGNDIAAGWIHYHPSRRVSPGTPVLFWNRTWNVKDATIDFGDGSASTSIKDQVEHAYKRRGTFPVIMKGRGPGNEPVSFGLRILVS